MEKRNKKQKTHHFNVEWEEQFCFIYYKEKSICLLCNSSVAIAKKCNVERHFITTHKSFNINFPINSEIRKKKISELKLNLTGQQSLFTRPISQSKKATSASFKIAHLLAKKMKPFVEGEIIKEAMLLTAETLFDDYKNKNEIITAINAIQLSARTVTRRIEMMATDIESQLNNDIQKSVFFSLQVDESTDVSDTSQLCIIAKMVFYDFSVKEEFLKILPLKGRTRGNDIYSTFKKYLEENNIPLEKLSAITTDGAPAMKGRNNGFIALCKKDPIFPKFASYHCIIHQEVLCSKVIPFQHIIETVTRVINSIRAAAMQHRLFKLLLQEDGAEFEDLITHTEVRWLSRGKILERFLNLLPQVKEFLLSRNEVCLELEQTPWLIKLGFLTDLTVKLKELNLKLQGRNHHIASMISTVNAFKAKLTLWKSHMEKDNLSHFPNLKMVIENYCDGNATTHQFAKHFDSLLVEFNTRFEEFYELEAFLTFFINPFSHIEDDVTNKIATYFDISNKEDLELEIINITNDIELKSHHNEEKFWNLVNGNSFPLLRKCALKLNSLCASTYACECLFSNMKYLKSKYRSTITDAHLDQCLRTGNSTYVPHYNELAADLQCQISH